MPVQEQTPYIEHIANGVTTSFALGFVCDSADNLIVTINDLPTNVGDWSFSDGNVVFKYPPLLDSLIKIWRNSPLARSTTFKTYDNSLNPNSLNFDFDKIWLAMQELNVKNSFSDIKLQELLDALVEGNINGLPAEVLARIAGDESTKSLVNLEALRAYQAENNLNVRIDNESLIASQNIVAEKQRAEAIEQSLQIQVNSVGVGNKAYKTYALMDADKANIPAKSKVTVTNDATASNNGDWQWDGVAFTKSAYDPLTQAKEDATTKANTAEENAKKFATSEALAATSMIQQTSTSNLHEFADAEGGVVASINSAGEFEAQDFKTESGNLSTVTKAVSQQEVAGYTHAFADSEGNIVFGVKQDGTVVGSSTAAGLSELRAGILSSDDMNTIGLNLDAKLLAETNLNFEIDVALYGADGTKSQRMPLVIQSAKNEVAVIYHQLGVDGTDQSYVALAVRFVTFNLIAKTAAVSATTQIIGDAINSPLVYHGANAIQLKNGNWMLTYGSDGKQWKMISTDKCRTWSAPTTIIDDADLKHAVANGLVRINGGQFNNRLVIALWGGTVGSNVGDNVGCFYSDDEGITWVKGGIIRSTDFGAGVDAINEVTIAVDASNNLIFAIRNEGYAATPVATLNKVIFAISKDGGLTLEKYGDPRFDASACQMSILQFAPSVYSAVPKIIMAQPTIGGFTRRKFRIRTSYDNLQTFSAEYTPFSDTLDIAYSSMCKVNDSVIAFAYEQGGTNTSQSVKLKFLNLAEII